MTAMKLLIISTLLVVASISLAFPRKHKKDEYERRRVIHHHSAKREHKHEVKHDSTKSKEEDHPNTKSKDGHEVYKKFGMFAAPTFALEDSADVPGKEQQSLQQVLVPVNGASLAQGTATLPQMISAFAAPSPRATLGTEVSQIASEEDDVKYFN